MLNRSLMWDEVVTGKTGGFIVQDNVKFETINWMMDQGKRWLLE